MRFRGLDLNLLVAFEVLLEERSVRRAADRLNLSQPATSAALARLRTFFDDEILVMQGKRMYSTPYADSLLPHVRECLQKAGAIVSMSSGFDPATSARRFRIVTSDYIVTALFAPLARRLAETAPHISFEFILPDFSAMAALERGTVDMIITPVAYGSDENISEPLFVERHVVVGCRTNPMLKQAITMTDFLAAGHIDVAVGSGRTPAFADRQLVLMGHDRRIEMTASSFAVLPWLVMGTKRLAVMHERLAAMAAVDLPIVYTALPFDFPMMEESVQYHRSRANDEGMRWLVNQLRGEALDQSAA